MKDGDIAKIINANKTNQLIFNYLDSNIQMYVIEVLENLDASNFKEINKDAKFDLTDIPIPLTKIQQAECSYKINCTSEINSKLKMLYKAINTKETNLEYPGVICANKDDSTYNKIKIMPANNKQSCNYDWEFIEHLVQNGNSNLMLTLFHTHPNPLNTKHNTLYNQHSEVLDNLGVKKDGLNLSLADIYANIYLENLQSKHNTNVYCQSMVLMHDGTLLTFQTKPYLQITDNQNIKQMQGEIIK